MTRTLKTICVKLKTTFKQNLSKIDKRLVLIILA